MNELIVEVENELACYNRAFETGVAERYKSEVRNESENGPHNVTKFSAQCARSSQNCPRAKNDGLPRIIRSCQQSV